MGVLKAKVGGVWEPVMEDAVSVFQEADEKAQPNGYASLDGTGKVPLAQLPPISSTPSRQTATLTTASLAAGATETGTIDLGKGYRLYRITASAQCRTRLYTTDAKRTADASRPIGTDPTGDHGLIFEFVASGALLAADLSPMVDGFDGKATPDGLIPWSVTNSAASPATLTITFIYVRVEG